MDRFEELAKGFEKVDPAKKGIIMSLLKDFVWHEAEVEKYKALPQCIVNPKDPTKQIKLPANDILHKHQASKNDIAVKILRSLDGEAPEVSALAKALAEFK